MGTKNYEVVQVLVTMGVTHSKEETTTELQSNPSFENCGN